MGGEKKKKAKQELEGKVVELVKNIDEDLQQGLKSLSATIKTSKDEVEDKIMRLADRMTVAERDGVSHLTLERQVGDLRSSLQDAIRDSLEEIKGDVKKAG